MGRIQNFKNWSPEMVPDPGRSSLGLEYFCTEGDELWSRSDQELIELGTREVERVGLVAAADVEDGCVVRVSKSYPVYDSGYREALAVLRDFARGLDNCQTIGRNGLHRYDNQDHAMLTGMLAARNVVLGEVNDVWMVNIDQDYHEEVLDEKDNADELAQVVQQTVTRVFNKLDGVALGLALGSVIGVGWFLATLALTLARPHGLTGYVELLAQYFVGYRVSLLGSGLALGYGLLVGFVGGWLFATTRNAVMAFYLTLAYSRVEKKFLRRLLDYL
jgi:hypothetical protein